ncbi:MAG: bifunctional (p)ppGpp synthetase/guanosine-3',5'-bis(diphosphate) 3'-pyrophosphohydrolase [Bdellovibrionales bacterium]|nr:bifunctional (p)ppGpp synthetase/guanosine-3',5'-bis(diphosphate) 3'-pyrophosphohydrolase [Bdellovibrionales bacterium]
MAEDHLNRITLALSEYHPAPDLALIEKAYDFIASSHASQTRASGEPYINHLVETALLVCKLRLDVASVTAALLHDTIEDCEGVTEEMLREEFGEDIAAIVEGVTKLTRVRFESQEEKQAEGFRKMLLAMAKDIRVVLVKLCDRLHNMRTIRFLPEDKQRRIALETREIYAPLAHRLGIHWIKSELEDLCLLSLRPEIYAMIKDNFARTKAERDKYVKDTVEELLHHLEAAGISASVSGRSKHFASIWEKMERNNLSFEEVYDLHGFRVIVPTVRACYETLGVIHSAWKPVPGRFKDYIAMPKPNMYQSLHTTVIGPEGSRIECQIRTPDMHRVAEEGIAAHWRYKERGQSASSAETDFDLHWVSTLVEEQKYLKNPDEFIQSVKGELFPEDVFVFTPKGDLIRLPYGSCTIDFAYAIHSDVGQSTIGAKINGSLVGLDHELENGDTIEVLTSKSQTPSRDWLGYVKSSKAKQRIRAFLKSEEHARSMAFGMELLSKELRKVKLSMKKVEKSNKLTEIAKGMGLRSVGDLYAQIGYGKVSVAKVIAKVLPDFGGEEEASEPTETSPLERIFQRAARASRLKVGVKVSGLEDIMIRYAKCCEPLPGDRIVGFITRGRGVTIHRADCSQVLRSDPLRQIDVSWHGDAKAPRRVKLTVHSRDSLGLLSKVSHAITENGANINSAQVNTTDSGKAKHQFEITIDDAKQLEKLIRAIEQVQGVTKVDRVLGRTSFGGEPSAR